MNDAFIPYPLRLTYGVRRYAFGARAIADRLGKTGVPDGVVAETWEVSDHPSEPALIVNGPYRGRPLGALVQAHPDAVVRQGWRGPHLPLLVKLLDAAHALPVHVHPDDDTAARRHGEPNGKDEAWHVLWAAPGAGTLVGVRPDVSPTALRAALLECAFDDVMLRHPLAAGDTVDVPAGVLHTFGPDTLILEVQQTSDLAESAAATDVFGRALPRSEREANVDATLAALTSDARPRPSAGVLVHDDATHRRVEGCRNERFVLERWTLRGPVRAHPGEGGFVTFTNLAGPLTIEFDHGEERIERASSCLLPASLGPVTLHPEPGCDGDAVLCFEPAPNGSA
jgi:mannose-6-phosphate isomerase